ncbi:MAG: SusC/RagA family TonB-linked outer membrane protein [Bacteroidota bacterium]
MIQKVRKLLFLICVFSISGIYAQTITVTGTVTSAQDGSVLPGVNVLEKGTTNGSSTDIDGKYSINVSSENATLSFSFLSFVTKEVLVSGNQVINVSLTEDAESLDEVVVTALGIRREQKALGFAVSKIDAEELTTAGNVNVMTSLYGKAAGVQIKSNPGGATAGVNVTIRGNNSMTGFNQPLFIVDGIPIEHSDSNYGSYGGVDLGNGANDLNPDDIETMTVLKGANASALYGSKAANGVVIITTKSGKGVEQGLGVTFNSSATIENVAYLPEYQNEYGSGYESQVFRTNADGENIYHNTWPSFGPKMEGQMLRWWDGEMRPYSPQPDNVRDIFEAGHTISNNISIAQNVADKINYRISYTNFDYKGTFPGVYQKRNVYSLNSKVQLHEKLDVGLVANYYDIFTHNRPQRLGGLAGYEYPRSTKYDLVRDNYEQEGYLNGEISGDKAPGMVRNMMTQLWNANKNDITDDKGRLIGNVTLNYRPIENLNVRARIGRDEANTDLIEEVASKRPINNGKYQIGKRKTTLDYMELLFTYDKNLTEDLVLNAVAGGSISTEKGTYSMVRTNGGLIVPNWFSLSNSVKDKVSSSYRFEERTDAVFGVFGLTYKDMLFIEATARNDWSSTLPPENNSYFYPSVSTSFVFSELLEDSDWLSFGKIRASWAETGNDAKRYQANAVYTYGTYNGAITNTFGANVPPLDLKPENQVSYEIGAELKMFKNRLGIDLTYYHNQNFDQIINLGIAPSAGSNALTTNAGQMDNKGVELQLYGDIIRNDDFRWNVNLNIAKNQNEVIELIEGIDDMPLPNLANPIRVQAKVGEPFGQWVAYLYQRDDAGNKVISGDGLYIRDDSERKAIGNVTPDFFGGLLNTIAYKNFTLNFNIDYSVGGDIFSFTNYYGLNAGKLKESLKYRDEAHGGLPYYYDDNNDKIQLPNHSANAPGGEIVYHDGVILDGVTESGAPNDKMISAWDYYINTYYWNYGMHEEGLFDNTYVKMREMSLTYDLDRDYVEKIGFQAISFSLIGRNLFFLYKNVPNIDPESFMGTQAGVYSSFEYGGAPGTTSYGLSLKLKF